MRPGTAKVTTIVATLCIISALYYATRTQHFVAHEIFQRVYYLPIVTSALWYGLRGGLLAALLAALLYIPDVLALENGFPSYEFVNQLFEVVLFFIFGSLAGSLADQQRRQRQDLEESAKRLTKANEDLQRSFDSLRRAERLSALGRLSAGLVHEIRNPLSIISGSLELAGKVAVAAATRDEAMQYIKEEVRRLNGMVNHFLEFARPRPPELEVMSVQRLMDEVRRTLSEFVASRTIKTVWSPPDFQCSVSVDPGQIREIVLNLVLNASEAMPKGGTINISAQQKGGHVVIDVKDDGTGIGDETLSNIFEPFFTTKSEGTGLGLPIVQQIMAQHDGRIEARNNSDHGMTFSLYFPCLRVDT